MKRYVTVVFAVVALSMVAGPASWAQSGGMKGMDMKGMDMKDMPMKKGEGGQAHKGTGTVKSVDAEKGTLRLTHGPIQSMNWPAMTMTFKAKDRAMLDNVKPGAKVEFSFVQSGKDYLMTEMK